MTPEEYVNQSKSKSCFLVKRNLQIVNARASGSTLQQIAIKFDISRRQVINILKNR